MAGDTNQTLFSEDEFLKFPEEARKKLARFLSEGHFDTDVSFEEVKLLRQAAGRLRHESLESACNEIEQQFDVEMQQEADQSSSGLYPPCLCSRSETVQLEHQHTQVYHVSIVKDCRNKPRAVVYDVTAKCCYVANIQKRSVRHCISACRHLQNDAPYILIRSGIGKREKILSYDLILNKWRTLPKSKRISFQPYLVEINESVYMFGGHSCDIWRLSSSKWRSAASLVQPAFSPMFVVVGSKLTIFDGKAIQVFDARSNKVNKYDTFTIPPGVAVNIANNACVLTNSAIIQFVEQIETCTLHKLNSNLLKNDFLVGAVCHKSQVHIITEKHGLHVYSLSLEDLSITTVCSAESYECPRDFTVLSSCVVQSCQDYLISPFLSYEEERKRKLFHPS